MQWSDISFTPPSRTLRQFAGLWLIFFSGLACWHGFVRHNTVLAITLALAAVAVGPLGLVKPQAIRVVYTGSMIVTFPIGWAISRVILALLFYLVFTPISFFFRLTGRDALQLKTRPELKTYWAPKKMPTDMRSYLRQF